MDAEKGLLASYEAMCAQGAVALSVLADGASNTALTFWRTPTGLAITQWSRDSGEVLYLRDVDDAQGACRK